MLLHPPCSRPDWRVHPPHAHYFQAVTTLEDGHRHRLEAFVYVANGNAYDGHIHFFQGVTQMANGHTHRFYDRTSPAIPLPDGSHVHTLRDVTYYNYSKPVQGVPGIQPSMGGVVYSEDAGPRHRHSYEATTSRNFGEPPAGW